MRFVSTLVDGSTVGLPAVVAALAISALSMSSNIIADAQVCQ